MADPVPAPPTWRDRLDLIVGPARPAPAQLVGGAVAAVALLVGAWFVLRQPDGPPAEASMSMAGQPAAGRTTSTTAADTVVVHAAGAVRSPGVYTLPAGSRVTDLLEAAGGLTPDADLDRLNLASPLADGSRVYVPRVGQPVPDAAGADGGAASAGTPSGPLDLNTATLEQLDSLPGVGPATAKAILDERAKRGRFRSVEELLDVRGIGPAKLEQLRDLVAV